MNLLNCEIIRHCFQERNKIGLTFDDGPHPINTPKILEELSKLSAYATFFVTGQNIIKHRQLVQEIVNQGHQLANHTFSHPHAFFTKRKNLFDEITRTKDLIEDISGKSNIFFRPPYGEITPSLLKICRELKLKIILWNVNSQDYKREHYIKIVKRILKKIRSGTIVLFHECHFGKEYLDYSNSIKTLSEILQSVHTLNLKPVTIYDLIND